MLRQPLTIICGLGFGISKSSLELVGKMYPSDSFGEGKLRTYFNAATGNVVVQEEGVRVVTPIGLLPLYFTYNSQISVIRDKWRLSVPKFKNPPNHNQDIILIDEDGAEVTYARDGNQCVAPYFGDAGYQSIIWVSDYNAWIRFDNKNQMKEYYDNSGLLIKREDFNGRAVQFQYDIKTSRLIEVSCTSDLSYTISYDDTNKTVIIYEVTPTSKKLLISHKFDANGLMESSSIPDQAYQITYGYDSLYGILRRINQTDQTYFTLDYSEYNPDPSITKLTEATFGTVNFDVDYTSVGCVRLKDTVGKTYTVYFDPKSGLVNKFDRSIGYLPISDYDSYMYKYKGEQLTKILQPDNGLTTISYESEYNDKRFECFNRKCNEIRPNGQITEYFYQLVGGVIYKYAEAEHLSDYQSKMPLCTNRLFIYELKLDKSTALTDGFLRFEVSPEGRVTEYVPDDKGYIKQIKRYLNTSYRVDTSVPVYLPNIQDVIAWANKYKQDIELSEFKYDDRGQVIQAILYTDVDANGVGVQNDTMQITNMIKDSHGNITLKEKLLSVVEQQKVKKIETANLDSLQRVTKIDKAPGENDEQVVQLAYLDDQFKIVKTAEDKVSTTEKFASNSNFGRGFLESVQEADRVTSYKVLQTGEPVITTHPDGRTTFNFYDQMGRVGFNVSATGQVVETQYSKDERVLTTIKYANPIVMPKYIVMPYLGEIKKALDKVKDPINDRYEYTIKDSSKRLCFEIDAYNNVIEYKYDSLDRKIATIQYAASSVSAANLTSLKNGVLVELPFSTANDRCSRIFYDMDGCKTGEQDAAGYVTELKRNAAGWITEQIKYSTKQPITTTPAFIKDIKPVASPNDAHTWYFYDHAGQCTLEVNAEGCATQSTYYASGKFASTRRFNQKVADAWLQNPVGMPALPVSSSEDHVTTYQYDSLNREILVSDSTDTKKETTYDNMNRIISTRAYDANAKNVNGDTSRGDACRYDHFGNKTHEANVFVFEMLVKASNNPAEQEKIWKEFSKRHQYDASGLRISTAERLSVNDVADRMTYYFYDQERRPVIEVLVLEDNTTRVMLKDYNSFSEVVMTRQYVKTLPLDIVNKIKSSDPSINTTYLNNELGKIKDDQHDAVSTQEYNIKNRAIVTTDPEGYITTKTFNAFDECESEQQVVDKNTTINATHQYDARGLEICTTTKSNELTVTVNCEYENALGKLTRRTDQGTGGESRSTAMNYNKLGQINQVTDAANTVISTTTYDAQDRVGSEFDAFGAETKHTYSMTARTHTITKPENGVVYAKKHNAFEEVISASDVLDNQIDYTHAPNGKLEAEVDQLGAITMSSYNLLGWKDESINKRQIKTAYTYSQAGDLKQTLVDVDQLKLSTTTQFNSLGQATNTIDPRGVNSQYQTNRNGLVKQATIDPAGIGLQVTQAFNGLGKVTTKIIGDAKNQNQQKTDFQFDAINRNIGQTVDPENLKLQSTKALNPVGNVVAIKDINGNTSRLFYDVNDRNRFVIDAMGGIIEREFDATGRVVCKRRYETGLSPAELAQLNDNTTLETLVALVQPKRGQADSVKWIFYNKDGKRRFKIDQFWSNKTKQLEGTVEENKYDLAERCTQLTNYVNTISTANINTLKTDDVAKLVKIDTHDRTYRYVLDAAGHQRFIIDPEGYVIEQRFNRMGQVIEKMTYSNFVNDPGAIAKLKPEEVLAKLTLDNTKDSYEYYVFDRVGLPLFMVTAEGLVTRYFHDENGNLVNEHQYAAKIPMPQPDYNVMQDVLYKLKTDDQNDRITQKQYDNANRQVGEISPSGLIEKYELNALGKREKYTDKENNLWQSGFDTAGQPVSKTSPATVLTYIEKNPNPQPGETPLKVLPATAPTSVCEKTSFDHSNNTRVVTAAVGLHDQREVKFAYNKCNNVTCVSVEKVEVDNSANLNLQNPSAPPVKTVTVSTQLVYNAKQLKIVEINENGEPTFYVYDELKRPIYEVQANGAVIAREYDGLSNEKRIVSYATPLSIDLSAYIASGIPRSVIEANIKNTSNDRIEIKEYDCRGKVRKLQRGPIFYYNIQPIDKNGKRPTGTLSNVKNYLENEYRHDANGALIYEHHKLDDNRKLITNYWVDRQANKVASCESVEKKDGKIYYRPNRYFLNAFGELEGERKYAGQLDVDQSHVDFHDLSLSGLDAKLAGIKDDEKDRQKQYIRDKNGEVQTTTELHCLSQEGTVENGKPPVFTDKVTDQVVTYKQNSEGKVTRIVHEDGSKEYKFYDARGYLRAEVSVPRSHPDKPEIVIVPLTYYDVNSHGENVRITRFIPGTTVVNDENPTFPQPIEPNNPKNQVKLDLHDNRGLSIARQDGNGNVSYSTYTPSKKSARDWKKISQYDINNPANTITVIDEKRFFYNTVDIVNGVQLLKDSAIQDQTWIKHDVFGQACQEGSSLDNLYIQRKFDTLGDIWFTNEEKGANTIRLFDLSGKTMAQIMCASTDPLNDLSKIDYEQLSSVFKFPDIEITQHERDLTGRQISQTDPAGMFVDPTVIPTLPLNMYVEKTPDGRTLLSWPVPSNANLQPQLTMLQEGAANDKKFGPFIVKKLVYKFEQGLIPGNADKTSFIEMQVQPGGDCGFNAIDTTRSQVVATLLPLSINQDARDYLSEEIRIAFMLPGDVGVVVPPAWTTLWVEANDATTKLESAYNDGYSLVTPEQASEFSREQLLDWLKQNHHDIEANAIEQCKITAQQTETALADYCRSEEAYEYYINAFNGTLWLGYKSALLYCKTKNQSLYIWRKDDRSSELALIDCQVSQGNAVFHLHHTDGFTHFNSLVEPTPDEKQKAIEEQNQQFIRKIHGRYYFNVSALPSDVYKFTLQFISEVNPKDQYQTVGDVEFNSGNNQNSMNLVATMLDDHVLGLSGNTSGITEVKLFNDQGFVADFPIKLGQTQIDLSSVQSGVYHIQAIKPGMTTTLTSMDFVVYTASPAAKSLSQEMDCDVALKVNGEQGTLTWNISRFENSPVKITCAYLATDDTLHTQDVIVQPNKTGASFTFDFPVKSIQSFSMSVSEEPTAENNQWLKIHDQTLPLGVVENADTRTFLFPKKRILYVTPVGEFVSDNDINYLDTSMDVLAATKMLAITSKTNKSFTVDVSGFMPGLYPFKRTEEADYATGLSLRITRNGSIFSQGLSGTEVNTCSKQPSRMYGHDNFDNVIAETDSSGNTTNREFDHRDQVVKRTDPETNIMKDGAIVRGQPVWTTYHNLRGYKIGSRDANLGCDLLILDSAGQQTKKILPDGVVSLTQWFDGLGNRTQHKDSSDHVWSHEFDNNNNPTVTTSPMGRKTTYVIDEDDRRRATTIEWHTSGNPALDGSRTTKNIFDVWANPTALIENGNFITSQTWDRNREQLSQANRDGSKLGWGRDPFGNELSHTDLSGCQTTTQYDQAKRPTYKTGNRIGNNQCLSTTPASVIDVPYMVQNPKTKQWAMQRIPKLDLNFVNPILRTAINIEWIHQSGRLQKIIDHDQNMEVEYIRDVEGNPVQVIIRQNGSVLRNIKAEYDELKRPWSQTDSIFTLSNYFDIVGNEVYKKGILTPTSGSQIVTESWNKFDVARRCVVSDGVLLPSKDVGIAANKGVQLDYEKNYRMHETRQEGGMNIVTNLSYDNDGYLQVSAIPQKEYSLTRIYDFAGQRVLMNDVIPFINPNGKKEYLVTKYSTNVNERGAELSEIIHRSDDPAHNYITTDYTLNTVDLPTYRKSRYVPDKKDGKYNTNDDIDFTYVGFDKWLLKKIHTKNWMRNRDRDVHSDLTMMYEPPTGAFNARLGYMVGEPPQFGIPEPAVIYTNAPDGRIIESTLLSANYLNSIVEGGKRSGMRNSKLRTAIVTPYFQGVDGAPLGRFQTDTFQKSLGMSANEYSKMQLSRGTGMGVGVNGGYVLSTQTSTGSPAPSFEFSSAIQSVSSSFPPPSPTEYVARAGDTFASIAHDVLGDSSFAEMIEFANDYPIGVSPSQGAQIKIPQVLVARKGYGVAAPYQRFVNSIIGNITAGPAVRYVAPDIEEEDLGFAGFLGILTVGVAVIAAPPLAATLFGTSTAIIGTGAGAVSATSSAGIGAMAATGVSAGLINAASQGLLVGVGIQQHFSPQNVLTSALAAGLAPLMKMPSSFDPATYGSYMLKAGAANAADQLLEMAGGLRSRFDVTSMVTSMTTAIVDAGVNNALAPSRFTGSVISAVTGNAIATAFNKSRFDLDSMMIQAVGASVLSVTREALEAHEHLATPQQTKQPTAKQATRNTYAKAQQAGSGSSVTTKKPTTTRKVQAAMSNHSEMESANEWIKKNVTGQDKAFQQNQLSEKNNLLQNTSAVQELEAMMRSQATGATSLSDTIDIQLEFLSELMKSSPAGLVIDSIRGTRNDTRTMIYGDSMQRAQTASILAANAALGVGSTFGVKAAGRMAVAMSESVVPSVGRFSMWSKGASASRNLFGGQSLVGQAGEVGVGAGTKLFGITSSPVKLVGHYNAYSTGNLSNRNASTFMGQKYSTLILEENMIMYRAGNESSTLGEFFMLEKPTSELQVRIDKAVLPQWSGGGSSVVNTGYEVVVPKGTMVHVGQVAPQGNIFIGGTQQILIEKPWLNPGIKVTNKFSLQEELLWNIQARK